jgi:hypothetical protein
MRLEHRRVSTRDVRVEAVEVAADGGPWRPVVDARALPEWAWGGRTLFTFSGGATELALGGAAARRLRVALRLLYRQENPVTSLCVRVPA